MPKNSDCPLPPVASEEFIPPAALVGRWVENLSADMPLQDAARKIVRQRCAGVLYYLFLAALDGDESAEPVHKLRVATRRLSAALNLVEAALPETVRPRLAALVRQIRRAGGKTRDSDMRQKFLEDLLPRVSVDEAEVIESLCEGVSERGARSRKRLRARLAQFEHELSRAGSKLLRRLGESRDRAADPNAAGQNESAAGQDEGIGQAPFRGIGIRCLEVRLSEVWETAESDLESPTAWHSLRIACKRLRYSLENCMSCLPRSFAEDYLDSATCHIG
ncbi:MAG: CHAD domain-containing protein [Planctomycetaceae bacterium]|nr:CHAD domain-containing protein [Planctomycetaceae bacterium]